MAELPAEATASSRGVSGSSYRGATPGCSGSTDRRVHRSRGRRRPCATCSTICSLTGQVWGGAPAPLDVLHRLVEAQAHDRVREVGPRTAQTDHRPDATERTQRGPGGPVEELVGHERLGLVWGMAADQGEQRSSGHIGVRTSGERLLAPSPTVIAATPSTPATAPRRAPRTRRGPRRLNPLIRSPLLRSFRRRLDPPATPRAASQPSRGTSAALQRACERAGATRLVVAGRGAGQLQVPGDLGRGDGGGVALLVHDRVVPRHNSAMLYYSV